MSKNLRWVLALSLITNVLFIGIAIGRWSREFPPPPPPPPGLENVPADMREHVEAAMRTLRDHDRDLMPKVDAKRRELTAIMAAQEFDEAAFRAKSKELDDLFNDSRARMVENTVRLARSLNLQERKLLAQHLRRPPPPPPGAGPPPPPPPGEGQAGMP